MKYRKIALIGNSGMGKTTIATSLGDAALADMDRHHYRPCPSRDVALDWMVTNSQGVLAVCVHMKMLRELRDAKAHGHGAERMSRLLFVFLYDSDVARRRAHLAGRPNLEESLAWDPEVYRTCRPLSDVTIDCRRLEMTELVTLIGGLRDAYAGGANLTPVSSPAVREVEGDDEPPVIASSRI